LSESNKNHTFIPAESSRMHIDKESIEAANKICEIINKKGDERANQIGEIINKEGDERALPPLGPMPKRGNMNKHDHLTLAEFQWSCFKMRLQPHNCNLGGTIYGHRCRILTSSGQTQAKTPIVRAEFYCNHCPHTENFTLLRDGHYYTGDKPIASGHQSTPLALATGVISGQKSVINSASSGVVIKYHEEKIDITPFLQAENPLKYFNDTTRVNQFLKSNPDVSIDQLEKAQDKTNGDKTSSLKTPKPKNPTKLIPSRQKHVVAELEKVTKKLSGCHLNLRWYHTSTKSFEQLLDKEKLGLFACYCRSKGKCGIKDQDGIKIQVFKDGTCNVEYCPQRAMPDITITVEHEPTKGVTPRPDNPNLTTVTSDKPKERIQEEIREKLTTEEGKYYYKDK
jgi:hypothetical protein